MGCEVVDAADASVKKATYRWLADGTKVGVRGAGDVELKYLGSLIYRCVGGVWQLESAAFGGGRIIAGHGSNGAVYTPNYFLTDHLGSTRVVFDDRGEVVERNDFLPFGGRWENPGAAISGNRFRFSGKEEQNPFGLPLLDFGWRMHDPRLGRWTTPDPLAESFAPHSPFGYVLNNPINLFDWSGLYPAVATGGSGNDPNVPDNYGFGSGSTPIGIDVVIVTAPNPRRNIPLFIPLGNQAGRGGGGGGGNGRSLRGLYKDGGYGATVSNGKMGFNSGSDSRPAGSFSRVTTRLNAENIPMSETTEAIDGEHTVQKPTDRTWPHLVGPALVLSGQRIHALKPYGMLGSKPGSSIASKVSRSIPGKLPFRILGTKGVGAAVGRAIPGVGAVIIVGDVVLFMLDTPHISVPVTPWDEMTIPIDNTRIIHPNLIGIH